MAQKKSKTVSVNTRNKDKNKIVIPGDSVEESKRLAHKQREESNTRKRTAVIPDKKKEKKKKACRGKNW